MDLEWESVKTCRVVVPHRVVFRTLASETVLLNVQTGHYYGMDETGGRFFDVLRDASSLAAAVKSLSEEFDASVEKLRQDLLGYCEELLELGLIELDHPDAGVRSRHG